MVNKVNRDICHDAITKLGRGYMLTVATEECGELIQAISKARRYGSDLKHTTNVAEEIADVMICCTELQEMYDIPDKEISDWISYKQDRTKKRLDAGYESTSFE